VEISKYVNKQYHVTNSVFLEREAVYKNFDEFFSKTSKFYKDKQHKKNRLVCINKVQIAPQRKINNGNSIPKMVYCIHECLVPIVIFPCMSVQKIINLRKSVLCKLVVICVLYSDLMYTWLAC